MDPETGEDLGIDEDGEIWIRGPQVMKGYLNNPEATALSIDEDGWLRTGDIGHVDADDHFFIVDRLKELIKYKGFQIAPAELEALLLTHPAIVDAAVIPIPDEEAGEVPKAFIVLRPDHELSAAEAQAFVAGHVAHYKQTREVEFVDEIPKSASGKIPPPPAERPKLTGRRSTDCQPEPWAPSDAVQHCQPKARTVTPDRGEPWAGSDAVRHCGPWARSESVTRCRQA